MRLDECWRDERSASWGKSDEEKFPRFFIGYPFDGGEANVGNGTMTAFLCAPGLIDQLHELALKMVEFAKVRRDDVHSMAMDFTAHMFAIQTATSSLSSVTMLHKPA